MNEYKMEMIFTCLTGDADHFYNTVLMIAKGFEIGVLESKLHLNRPETEEQTTQPTSTKVSSVKKNLNTQEAADYIGVSKQTMYRYTSEAIIPHYKIGNRTLFSVEELDEWIQDHKVKKNG